MTKNPNENMISVLYVITKNTPVNIRTVNISLDNAFTSKDQFERLVSPMDSIGKFEWLKTKAGIQNCNISAFLYGLSKPLIRIVIRFRDWWGNHWQAWGASSPHNYGWSFCGFLVKRHSELQAFVASSHYSPQGN